MSKKMCTCLTAVCLILGCLGVASAQGRRSKSKTVRVAILPVQVKGLQAETGKELGSVVVRELREIGVFRVVPGKMTWRKLQRLRRRKIFTDKCTEKKRCIRAVGRALRAKVVYHMEVTKEQEGIRLDMRTFDVRSGKMVRQSAEFASEESGDLEQVTRWVTRKVSSPMITKLAVGKGKLEVKCEYPRADLFLNGKNYGNRTGKSFKVSSGVFDIVVKVEGYGSFHDVVVVKPGQKKVVNALLELKGETRPMEVAAITPEEPPGGPEAKEAKKKPELPPWAVFEKKEPKPLETGEKKEAGAPGEKETTKTGVMPWQQITKSKAYLPDKDEEPVPTKKKETRFYQTWWFWTVTVAVVAGAGGTAAWYFLLREEGPSGYGDATVSWQ